MITIEQEVWGMTPEGEGIIRYTMRNESGAYVQLSNYGATILSAVVPDRDGKMADVVLGYKAAEGYFYDGPAMGKSVGRFANRIAFGQLEIAGEKIQLEINCGRNHLHGGTKNFANRVWESRVETNRVVMSLTSEDGDQKFPGELNVEAIFDFDEENQLEITYLAKTDRTTVVNLTNHVYFNLDGESAGTILDHELQVNTTMTLAMNENQVPTGAWISVEGSAQDFRSFRRIGEGIESDFNHIRAFGGYDHPFPIDGWRKNILGEVGALRSQASGRLVKVLSSQPSVMVYTGNWLAGSPQTKSDGYYQNHAGVALECQNFPDAPNQPSFPSATLEPGELYCQKIVYRFETF